MTRKCRLWGGSLYLVLMASGEAQPPPAPTYTGEVAALLSRHCVGCHNRGGAGRVALDTYEQARAFSREIRDTANNRQMPPVFAVPGYGDFRNEDALTIAEIQTLIRWADAGSPYGAGQWKPVPTSIGTAWQLGQPDLVLETPRSLVSGGGGFERRCFAPRTNQGEAQAVRAIDVLPGDRRVVYHVRVFAVQVKPGGPPADSLDCHQYMRDEYSPIPLGEWAPHLAVEPLPAGVGRLLPAKAALIVEVTYQNVGVPVTDSTRVGLYFQRATRYVHVKAVSNREFAIPAGEWNYRADANWTPERAITVLSIAPHMHRLGTEMRIIVTLPDGDSSTLLWVRDYDHNRQKAYIFKNFRALPKGSRIDVSAYFNNSDSNARLPHEPRPLVRWGPSAEDEMLTAFIEYVDGGLSPP